VRERRPSTSPEPVVIAASEVASIRLDAERGYPRLTCGVILTRGTKLRVLPCRNIQDDLHAKGPRKHPRDARTAFFVAPEDLKKIGRLLGRGFAVGVIYHSNTDAPAHFCGSDRRAAPSDSGTPLYPGTAYVVVSVVEGRAVDSAAFRGTRSCATS
jgi:proteasome lid subunit RPN8/RPN11